MQLKFNNLIKNLITIVAFLCSGSIVSQKDSTLVYKKRVLETIEVNFLSGYYNQKENNTSVTGGIGIEKLSDITSTIVVSIPMNDDDVLTIYSGISAYSSASSSNGNPFDVSGSSGNNYDDNDNSQQPLGEVIGSPWVSSSGASKSNIWANINVDYSHSSDDRNTIWNADVSLANEYDYSSIGFGGGFKQAFQ